MYYKYVNSLMHMENNKYKEYKHLVLCLVNAFPLGSERRLKDFSVSTQTNPWSSSLEGHQGSLFFLNSTA